MLLDLLTDLLAAGTVFGSNIPDGFVSNRTLLIGFAVTLFAGFLGKLFFRTLDECRRERHDERREIAATSGHGPPSFNG